MKTLIISLVVKGVFLFYILIVYIFFFKIPQIKHKIIIFLGVHLLGGVILTGIVYRSIKKELTLIKEGDFYKITNITIIRNQEGKIIGRIGSQNREYEELHKIPPLILTTFLTVEDESFFHNYGINMQNTFLNLLKALFTTKKILGASTITQQLARNLFLSNKISLLRKLQEAFISLALTYYLPKEKILEIYVNHIFFGDNTYGIRGAARNFFNKELDKLEVEEIAFLVGLIKGPSYYWKNFHEAIERKNYVLFRLYKTGVISEDTYGKAMERPIIIEAKNKIDACYGYIIEGIKEELQALNLDPNEGLVVHINIEDELQRVATKSLQEVINEGEASIPWQGPIGSGEEPLSKYASYENRTTKVVYLENNGHIFTDKWTNILSPINFATYKNLIPVKSIVLVEKINKEWHLKNPPQLNGAVIVIDPHTGKVLSSVGGRGFDYSFFDGVTQAKKSPGSIAKIFPCIAAFENGYTPELKLRDSPIYIDENGKVIIINDDSQIEFYRNKRIGKFVKNYDNKYQGDMTLGKALEQSRNIPMILITSLLGVQKVRNTALKMGAIEVDTPFYLSGALGAIEVPVTNMALALATIPNGGYKLNKLHYISHITDLQGNLLYTPLKTEEPRERILTPQTIYFTESICQRVIKSGIRHRLDIIKKKIAGKTGTAQENKAASFVVWSSNYLVYVLIYYMDHREVSLKLWGNHLPIKVAKDILVFLENSLEETHWSPHLSKEEKK